jgi:hypothetical protein
MAKIVTARHLRDERAQMKKQRRSKAGLQKRLEQARARIASLDRERQARLEKARNARISAKKTADRKLRSLLNLLLIEAQEGRTMYAISRAAELLIPDLRALGYRCWRSKSSSSSQDDFRYLVAWSPANGHELRPHLLRDRASLAASIFKAAVPHYIASREGQYLLRRLEQCLNRSVLQSGKAITLDVVRHEMPKNNEHKGWRYSPIWNEGAINFDDLSSDGSNNWDMPRDGGYTYWTLTGGNSSFFSAFPLEKIAALVAARGLNVRQQSMRGGVRLQVSLQR